jgi:hypothetical protein
VFNEICATHDSNQSVATIMLKLKESVPKDVMVCLCRATAMMWVGTITLVKKMSGR